MRIFLDANVMTYITVFEGYLLEGTPEELHEATEIWARVQGDVPDASLRREIEALRILYLVNDQARFDWLFSGLALAEIERISSVVKRQLHQGLIRRLVEHREDVYLESGFTSIDQAAIDERVVALFPSLPKKMMSDAQQFCEAEYVEAYYFVTNDLSFIRVAQMSDARVDAVTPSNLPFVAPHLVVAKE